MDQFDADTGLTASNPVTGKIKSLLNMSAQSRAGYLVLGSIAAALTMLIPDMYEVNYKGPALPKGTNLDGVTGNFSALSGPYDGKPMLASFIFLFFVGVLTGFMDFTTAWKRLSTLAKTLHIGHHVTAVGANFLGLWTFFSQFNNGGLPKVISGEFVKRTGGGAQARANAAYLYPSFGLAAILLVMAVGFGLIGVIPLFFVVIDVLALGFFVVTVAAAFIGLSLPWSPGMVNVHTFDGRRPTISDACVLKPGGNENCASLNRKLAFVLPNPAKTTAGCTYAVTVDWGDRSPVKTVTVKGTASARLYQAQHSYKGVVGAWRLTVKEKLKSGHCPAGKPTWQSEFALGEKLSQLGG